jgi:tetratricopeptide (TPR) repeat protein
MVTVVPTASAREFLQARRARSSGLLQLAQVLARTGDFTAVEHAQREALELRRAIAAEDPNDRQSTIDLMVAQLEIGDLLLRRRESAAAVKPLREAVDLGERLANADPHDVFVRLSRLSALVRLSAALHAAGTAERDEAARLIDQAIGIARPATAADPADVRFQFELAQAYAVRGDLESEQHRLGVSEESGAPWYERSLAILRELGGNGRLAGGTLNGDEPARMAEIEDKLRNL